MESSDNLILSVITRIQKNIPVSAQINNGGCIQFAYYLSCQLKQHGIKHAWVFIDREEYDYQNLFIDGCHHVMIYIPSVGYVDGEITIQELDPKYEKDQVGYISSSQIDLEGMRILKDEPYVWNYTYQKSYNYQLEEIIKFNFRNV